MENKNMLLIRMELLWLAFTVLLTVAILYPVYRDFSAYNHWVLHAANIAGFITFTRYLFLLRYTFWAKWQYIKIAILILFIPIVGFLVTGLESFHKFMDEVDTNVWMAQVPELDRENLVTYIRNTMTFFGVGSIISGFLLPVRILVSIWTWHNKGKV